MTTCPCYQFDDGIIDENRLTRAKFSSCNAFRCLGITQHFEIRVAKFYYFGDVKVQIFEDELADDELLDAAMFFQFTDY